METDKHLAQRHREREQLELERQQHDADRQARQQEQLLDELRRRELETREQAEHSAAEARTHTEWLTALEVYAALADYQLQTVQTQPPVVNNYSHSNMSPSQNTVPTTNCDMTSQCETATTPGYTEPPIAVLVDTSEPATQLNSSTTNTVVASPLHQSTVPPCKTYLSATILQPAPVTTSHVPSHMQVTADVHTHTITLSLLRALLTQGSRQTLSLQLLKLL